MLRSIFKNQKALYFIGGVATAIIGGKYLKSETNRKLCVKGLAKGMRLKDSAMETFQNLKEDATDMYLDAKKQVDASE